MVRYHLLLFLIAPLLIFSQESKILLIETSLKINALDNEKLYFGFAKGDKIILNYELVHGKHLKEFEVIEYPSTAIFMDYKTKSLKDKEITIHHDGIYYFHFNNTSLSSKVLSLRIERIPKDESTMDFNHKVYWGDVIDTTYFTEKERQLVKTEYLSKTLISASEFYINSGSNATYKGGKSRITFPIKLPKHTVEWYYQFSASRREEEINNTKSIFNLAGQLSTLIDQSGSLKFGIDALTQPPGSDYCDIYLLDQANSQLFEYKTDFYHYPSGTRANFKSGIVKMEGGELQTFYIGIKNPDPLHGIHVLIEVVAIVLHERWETKDVQKYSLRKTQIPYLGD